MALISKSSQALLEELRNSHNWCCIEVCSDYNYVWFVRLTQGHPGNEKHKVSVISGNFEDLNDAIIDAYKKAKVYKRID